MLNNPLIRLYFLEGVALGWVGPLGFFTSSLPYRLPNHLGPKSKQNMSRYAFDAISHTISREICESQRPISMQKKGKDYGLSLLAGSIRIQ